MTSFAFDSAHSNFTLRVKLEPKQEYAMLFMGRGFASVDGYPLKEYVLRFGTR